MTGAVNHRRSESRSPSDLPDEVGYTCEGAALALADMYPISEDEKNSADTIWENQFKFWVDRIFGAMKSGVLKVRRSDGVIETPKTYRTFIGRISVKDLNRWLKEACDAPYQVEDVGTAQETLQDRINPVPRLVAQDAAILLEISSRKLDPFALPKPPAGKRGIKADIRESCLSQKKVFQSKGVFDEAWQRLRDKDKIGDRTD